MPAVLLLVLLVVATDDLASQAKPPSGRARITYLTSTTAYLDAGREDGLTEGMTVHVVRGGVPIGSLKVLYLASHRASCELVAADSALAVGDTATFHPAVKAAAPRATGDQAGQATPRKPTLSASRVRGRVGLRYLMVRPLEGRGFTQPAADFRLDGPSLGGSPVGVVIDARARQTYRQTPTGSTTKEARTSLYQAAVTVRSPGGPRLTVGRQYLPTVSSVSLFDGALAEYQHSRFGVGAFAGSEPEPVTMGYSSDFRDFGLFVEGRNAPGAATRWSVGGGVVGSYRSGVVNREFGFLQGFLATPRVSLFVAQEVDLNRDWKADAGEPTLSLTSTFVTLSARPSNWLTLQGGLDNRRNVRLYRDLENPEVLFDDAFRQGVWGGAALTIGRHGRLGGDARMTLGGADSSTRTRAINGYAAVERITAANLSLRARVNRYSAVLRQGWLFSVGAGLRPTPWLGLEATGGRRTETVPSEPAARMTDWYGLDLDVGLGRRTYFLLSGSRERGPFAAGDQVYASLSYRF